MQPKEFCQKTLENLLKISTKRGINRSKAIKNEVASIKEYLVDLYFDKKILQTKVDSFHGDTTTKLREVIDNLEETIVEKDREIAELTAIRAKINRVGNKMSEELSELRERLGEQLPTFLDDTELT